MKAIENQLHASRDAELVENPEKIIAHDCGSTLLGLVVAFLGLDLYRAHAATRSVLLFPLLTAALPLLDLFLAMVRRLRRRSSAFTGDRFHLYDLLGARGWPVRRIVLAFYGVTGALAAIGLWGARSESPLLWAVAPISVGSLLCVAIRLGSLRGDDRDGPAQDSRALATEKECGELSQTD